MDRPDKRPGEMDNSAMESASLASGLEERYRAVCNGIARAARQANRDPESVQLVVASKTQPVDAIEVLLRIGHRVFGENRVQEAQDKWSALKARYPDVRLHLIGPLQTNKAKEAVHLFDVIETVDRGRLAKVLADEQLKQNKTLRYMIEVNIGAEKQKSGIMPDDAALLLDQCRNEYNLQIDGLMCIPPADQQASPYFARLVKLAGEMSLPNLSMGMTADYPLAIQLGATHVRVGTAIFGHRIAVTL